MINLSGEDGVLYYMEGGLAGAGTFVLATNIKDLDYDESREKKEATTRASGKLKQYRMGYRDLSITFGMMWDPEDPAFAAFHAAYLAGGLIGIRCLDCLGGEGPELDMLVNKFAKHEKLGDPQNVDVELCPGRPTVAPTWHARG